MQNRQEYKKQCSGCHLWLSGNDFYINRLSSPDGLTSKCKTCQQKYNQSFQTPEKRKKRMLKLKYGITPQQYNRMLTDQNGTCAICKMAEKHRDSHTGAIRMLAVDHDHKTGDVRALLCDACNTSLGKMGENPERIKALLDYALWCETREPNVKIVQLSILEDE